MQTAIITTQASKNNPYNSQWKTRTIWIKEWNETEVFIEDRLDKFRPMWIPRTAIRNPKFDRKRDFGKNDTHYIYEAEVNENWWNAHLQLRGFEFETNNGHRKSWWS